MTIIDKVNDEQLLLFDGVCNLCNRVVHFIIKRDGNKKFRFAALQSAGGQEILKQNHLPLNNFTSFIYIKKDKFYLKSSAALQVLKDLGGGWKLFYAFIIIPSFFRDFIYERIAMTRYKIFGKRESCMVPTPEIKERFLRW